MLVRQINNAMVVEDTIKNVFMAYVENATTAVELTDKQSDYIMVCSDEAFEAYINLIVNEAEHEQFLAELSECE